MKFTTLLWAYFAHAATAAVLVERECSPNNCARAVTGTDTRVPLTRRRADCSSFMTATVTPAVSTVTQTLTTTIPYPVVVPRQVTVVPSAVPTYASACSGAVRYSSACSCWGITANTVTVAAPTTTTVVTATVTLPPAVVTARGIIQVKNLDGDQVLGFVGKASFGGSQLGNKATEEEALFVTFETPAGATSVVDAEFTILESDLAAPNTFLGLIQGRDNTDDVIQPGSYHYLYLSGTNHSPPNALPAFIGNSYSSATGRERSSESSVWAVDLVSGALTPKWTNPDGTPINIALWLQSTAVYGGGDAAAFLGRYPAPVTTIQLVFLPRP